jgi:hypothetical protein
LLIREALDRAEIPAWYSEGSQKVDLAGRAFLLLLRSGLERFSTKRFAEYLSLGQSPVPVDPRWERFLRQACVIAGADRWKTRLSAAAEQILATSKNPEADIRSLDSLKELALPLIELLVGLPKSALWREWLAKLDQLAVRGLSNPRSVLELLEELAPLADLGPVRADEVMLSDPLREVLAAYWRWKRPADWLFPGDKAGCPFSTPDIVNRRIIAS